MDVHTLTHDDEFSKFLFQKRQNSGLKLVKRGAELKELNDPGRNQREWYPSLDLPAKTLGFHVAELAPGHRSGTHRHTCEALLYILDGQGATTIDGERLPWSAGDTVYVPPMAWHCHENDGDKPARVLGMWNIPLLQSLGVFFQQELADTGHPDALPSNRDTIV
jgi:gentisate 1,2-dioxygenase